MVQTFPDFPTATPNTFGEDLKTYLATGTGSVVGRIEDLEEAATTFNVKTYGATGDGTTDDSQAFLDAQTAMVAAIAVEADGFYRGNYVLEVGPGTYKIVDPNALMGATAAPLTTFGFKIKGAGKHLTRINFEPASSAYLMSNIDYFAGTHIEGIEFRGMNANANFLYSERTAAGFIQQFTYSECVWQGTWGYGYRIKGTDNNSEWYFERCEWKGDWANAVVSNEDTDQSVNWTFIDPDVSIVTGNWLNFAKGGNITVIGGNLIITTSGTLYTLTGVTHSGGTCNFRQFGGRVELRTSNCKLIETSWSHGQITFVNVDSSPYAPLIAPFNTAIFDMGNTNGPAITFRDCAIQGHHEYIYGSSNTTRMPGITYENCTWWEYTDPEDGFLFTPTGAHTNVGCKPIIRLRNCKGAGDTVQIWNADLNWNVNVRGIAQRWIVFLNSGAGTNPSAGATRQVNLPPNALIVRTRIIAPAGAGSASTTGNLTIQTGEGTPTVFSTVNPNPLSGAFDSGYDEWWFLCDTDAKRSITLTSDAGINATKGTSFFAMVEYIA